MLILYIDPGTGSMLISATIALISVAFFMLKGLMYRRFNIGGDEGEILDPNKNYGLVYYSEGSQYWNVFKPLVEESSMRGIPAYYLTSDKKDPGLNAAFEGITTIYIGSGREAYFSLNRIKADLVVMTTPGLDVLELKRSKNVKHYAHVGHALGSVAGYKSYGVDYFDSVLIGGQGDIEVIRELEKVRNLPQKKIEVIGHPYLDVLREDLQKEQLEHKLFDNNRETILISPTWGNHGLLNKYGDELLKILVESDVYNIIVRPHPQSFVSDKELLDVLMINFPTTEYLIWNRDISNLNAMSQADIMISDFSGIIFDYFSLFKKPILTIHSQYEKRGRDAMDLKESPWDILLLDKIGKTINDADIENIVSIIDVTLKGSSIVVSKSIAEFVDTYPNQASFRGIDFIEETLSNIRINDQSEISKISHLESNNVIFTKTKSNFLLSLIDNILNPSMVLQYVLAASLLVVFAFFSHRYFPFEGLNKKFLGFLVPISNLILIIMILLLMLSVLIIGKGDFKFNMKRESFDFRILVFIALPLTPVVQYIFSNQDILDFRSSLLVLIFFVTLILFFAVIVPQILSPIVSKNITTPLSLGILYVMLNMASFGVKTPMSEIYLTLSFVIIIVFLSMFFQQRKILGIALSIFLITSTLISFTGYIDNNSPGIGSSINEESKLFETVNKLEIKNTPDIYLLVYDSYANQETLESYGYDNSKQIDYLLGLGFTIYDGTHSINNDTLKTMASVLNPISNDSAPEENRRTIANDNILLSILSKNNYNTNLVLPNDYSFRGETPTYSNTFPTGLDSKSPERIIIEAIVEGEFRFDADFTNSKYEDYLYEKSRSLSRRIKEPKFLYTHSDYPGHSQNSGVLRPDESEIHFTRLDTANVEMRQDLDDIGDLSNAIVIIMGDHGPYLTKNGVGLSTYPIEEINRLDIQDRYGTFLAISWPSSAVNYEIDVVQDTMLAALSYLYEDISIFEDFRPNPDVVESKIIGLTSIVDGKILGGLDNGKELFVKKTIRRTD